MDSNKLIGFTLIMLLIVIYYSFFSPNETPIVEEENEKGEWIFENFYEKNSIQHVFQYLDEETTMAQDLKIMGSLFSSAFIKAFFKSL